MHPHPNHMLMAGGGVSFVGLVNGPSSTGPISFPAGARAGDLAVVIGNGGGGDISGWDRATQGANLVVLSKRLTQGIIDAPPSFAPTVGSFGVLVYRGAVRAEKAAGVSLAAAPVTIPGFTKDGARGLVTAAVFTGGFVQDPPTNFSWRHVFVVDGGFRYLSSGDLLSPSLYTDGTGLTWGTGGSGFADLIVMELI
jgi:hypothetical protein